MLFAVTTEHIVPQCLECKTQAPNWRKVLRSSVQWAASRKNVIRKSVLRRKDAVKRLRQASEHEPRKCSSRRRQFALGRRHTSLSCSASKCCDVHSRLIAIKIYGINRTLSQELAIPHGKIYSNHDIISGFDHKINSVLGFWRHSRPHVFRKKNMAHFTHLRTVFTAYITGIEN